MTHIDNEARMLALITAYSTTTLGNVIERMFDSLGGYSQWKLWVGRVGFHSNPSDAPSRLQGEELLKLGVVQDTVAWDVVILSFERTLHELQKG